MRVRLLGILMVTLLQAPGCSNSSHELTEIRNTLATRANALNSKDVTQYLSVVSLHYNDKGKYFAPLRESVEKNFRDFEQISYEAGTPTITIDGNHAGSTGSYRMKVQVRGKEMSLNGTEHLRLAKEPEGWKIIAGI